MSWPFTNLEWVGTATSSCEAKAASPTRGAPSVTRLMAENFGASATAETVDVPRNHGLERGFRTGNDLVASIP